MYTNSHEVVQSRGLGLTIFVSILTSVATSTGLFFGLRSVTMPAKGEEPASATGDAIEVPSIVGIRTEQARELLNAKGLILTLADEQDDPKIPAGSILSQTPLAGSMAKPSTEIRAVVSRGLTTPKVPEVSGLSVEAAAAKIRDARLTVGEPKSILSDSVPKGAVVGTTPPAGTSVEAGAMIQLNVSGEGDVEVPRVVGMGLSRAKKALAEAGFVVGSTRFDYNEDYGGNIVLRQSPEAGSRATKGSKIDLVLNEPD